MTKSCHGGGEVQSQLAPRVHRPQATRVKDICREQIYSSAGGGRGSGFLLAD